MSPSLIARSALFALVLILAGCGGSGASGGGVLLAGSTWSLERIVYPTGEVARGTGETVAFGSDGSLSLSSCNTCQGRFRMRGGNVSVSGDLGCTRMACSAESIELETFFAGDISVRRDGAYLIMTPEASGEMATTGEISVPQLIFLPTQVRAQPVTP